MANYLAFNIRDFFKPAVLVPNVSTIVSVLARTTYIVAALVFLAMLIKGAYQFIMAGGNAENYKSAQSQMKTAILGIVIIVISYAVIKLLGQILNIYIPI